MTRPLPCSCDPSDTARCGHLRQLVHLRGVMAKEAERERDPVRQARLWLAHHRYTVEIAAHLSGEAVTP
jgi:hypothetical protein